jgi:hypothetical protein
MDWLTLCSNHCHSLVSSAATPVLPGATALRVALPVVWAVLLGCAVMAVGLAQSWPRNVRVGLAVAVALWALVPGPLSPTYWLGLAFQIPSLMTVLICLGWVRSAWRADAQSQSQSQSPTQGLKMLGLMGAMGVLLGWLLLLDTLALLPFSVYRWGFGTVALAVIVAGVALAVCLPWRMRRAASTGWGGTGLVLIALAVFVLTRLPTGNLWDALIDPWLWLALQGGWLARGWRYLRDARSGVRVPS